jgi:ABC-type nickel/cobalt efflux system permease component RcnA
MSDKFDPFGDLRQKLLSMLVLLFLFSLVVHVSARLLEPVLPLLVVLLALWIVWRVVFGRRRWEWGARLWQSAELHPSRTAITTSDQLRQISGPSWPRQTPDQQEGERMNGATSQPQAHRRQVGADRAGGP